MSPIIIMLKTVTLIITITIIEALVIAIIMTITFVIPIIPITIIEYPITDLLKKIKK